MIFLVHGQTFIVHGETESANALADTLSTKGMKIRNYTELLRCFYFGGVTRHGPALTGSDGLDIIKSLHIVGARTLADFF